ncbi:MAG: CHAT domain-containing protein [Symploca sp. SIO2D2]|nr:CHAT domain-containing protein [Symploca sp. SIO2D2]
MFTSPRETLYLPSKCRILAILGNSQGINLEEDEESLNNLHNVEINWLREPSRKKLVSMLWQEKWDILFFAGHSHSEQDLTTGNIAINSQDSLNLQELKSTLRHVQQNGLKLAIFNSCDGLGLANALVDLRIPYIIVMREPVPDQVAQDFLQFFLERFSTGISLHKAFRQAREQLESLDQKKYPGAVQIPVIVQHPTAPPLIWQQNCLSRLKEFVSQWQQYRTMTVATSLLAGFAAAFVLSRPMISEIKQLKTDVGELQSKTDVRELQKKVPDQTSPTQDSGGVSFYCKDGIHPVTKAPIPVTVAQGPIGEIPVVYWVRPMGDMTPKERCWWVSSKFDSLQQTGDLEYIKHGYMYGKTVICTAEYAGGQCVHELFTLFHQENPREVLKTLFGVQNLATEAVFM